MRKTVCIDINSVLPAYKRGHFTGIGRACFELVKELLNIGDLPYDLTLYSQNLQRINPSHMRLPGKAVHLNLPYRRWLNKHLSYTKIRTAITKANLWHCPHNADYVDEANKTIFTLHDMIFYACKNEFPLREKEYLLRYLPTLMHSSKAIITCSASSKQDIIKYLDISPEKIEVINWGVQHELFKPLSDIEKTRNRLFVRYGITGSYFFSVSCGYGRKNTMQLLRAYEKLLKNDPVNDLVIVWNNHKEDAAYIISHSKNRIICLNNVTDQDLVMLYNCASALIFPSAYEGFGMPVLEAMACGIPVISYKNSSFPEVGGNHIIYMSDENELGILEVMENFENNDYDLVSLKNKGISHAGNFTWKTCAHKTAMLYQKCLFE